MTAYNKQNTRKDGSTIFLLKTRKNRRRRVIKEEDGHQHSTSRSSLPGEERIFLKTLADSLLI
jgi:hypothetical protein